MPGARCTRSLVCSVLVAHECRHHGRTGTPGIPARNGFNGLLRTLPGDRAFLSPSPALLHTDLTPASRRQDHTTSPSAKSALSSAAPPASTASRPASVTIAIRPSVGRDGERYRSDLGQAETKIFLQPGLDMQTACRANHTVPSLRGAQRRSNPAFTSPEPHDGLLRGACHRARIRATRWLAMTAVTPAFSSPPSASARRSP